MSKRWRIFTNILLAVLILALNIVTAAGDVKSSDSSTAGDPVCCPQEVIVGYENGGTESVSIPGGATGQLLKEMYESREDVSYVEYDQTACVLSAEPNDTYYGEFQKQSFDAMNITEAWAVTSGSEEIVIAVLDTGVDASHPELNGRILDGGYNFVNESNDVTDYHGHGTMMAGIIAASADNGKGAAGAADSCMILPVKVLDSSGYGLVSDIASGIIYAAEHGANVINLSLNYTKYSQTLQDAVDYAYSKGVVVVAASGNTGGAVMYPAACEHTIAVGAITASNDLASYSCYGNEQALVAVGSKIFSTTLDGAYAVSSGTSYAAVFVASLSALLLSVNNEYTPEQLMTIMQETATDLGDAGWDEHYGYGCVNFGAALNYAAEEKASAEKQALSNDRDSFKDVGAMPVQGGG